MSKASDRNDVRPPDDGDVRVHTTNKGGPPATSFDAASSEAPPSEAPSSEEGGTSRRTVRIYDRAMCCSTGVCGPQVDPVLPRFAADLEWLKERGHDVARFNLAQDPAAFANNPAVREMLAAEGVDCLPLVIVDSVVVSRRDYPSREDLALWTGTPLQVRASLPMADGGCCGGADCC